MNATRPLIAYNNASDLEVFAKTVYGEARGEGFAGQVAVAWVIVNRALRPSWWGQDLPTVCLAPKQFSCWNSADPNRTKLMHADIDDLAYMRAYGICCLVLAGELADPTDGADHYHASSMPSYPTWARNMYRAAVVGGHVFYRDWRKPGEDPPRVKV